jgi:hypothetical protein
MDITTGKEIYMFHQTAYHWKTKVLYVMYSKFNLQTRITSYHQSMLKEEWDRLVNKYKN